MTSPDEIQSLKRQLEKGWSSLASPTTGARGGAGGANAQGELALLPADLDEGGTVEKLSTQLTMQLGYNNELLRQVQELEESVLAYQKDAAEKKVALRQALGVCENVRVDLLDAKKKLAAAEETRTRAVEEANLARGQLAAKEREIDSLVKYGEESQREMLRLKHEKDEALREAERAQREQKALREEINRMQEEERIKAAERRADHDAAVREISALKARVGPLEAELKAERARAEELNEDAKNKTQAMTDMAGEMQQLRAAMNTYKDRAERAAQLEDEWVRDGEAKTLKVQAAEAQVQAARELVNAMEEEAREARRNAAEAVNARRDAEGEVRELKAQLEAVGNDLFAQTQARRTDRERFEARVAAMQAELEALGRDAREVERRAAEEAAERERDVIEVRRAAEESKTKLQNENARLNDLLQGLQRELQTARAEFQGERVAYEERIADAVRKQRHYEALAGSRDAAVAEELARLKERLVDAGQQLAQRTRVHVDSLGALEATVGKLAGECARLRGAHDSALDELARLRAALREALTQGNAPLEEWHEESRRALASVAEAAERAAREREEAVASQAAAEVARDEERSRAFVAEEEARRAEEDARTWQDKFHALESAGAERLRVARIECDSAVSARADLEAMVRRLQDQLERANMQNRSMQEDVERTGSSLAEAHLRARERAAQLEEALAAAKGEALAAIAARDAERAEAQLLRKKLEASAEEARALMAEARQREDEARGTGVRDGREAAEHQKRLALLSENMRKQSTQLTQTKSLLQVVQEQRKRLQEENMALRAELDEVLSRSLRAATGGGGGGEERDEFLLSGGQHQQHSQAQHDFSNISALSSGVGGGGGSFHSASRTPRFDEGMNESMARGAGRGGGQEEEEDKQV